MLLSKLIHVSKRSPWWQRVLYVKHTQGPFWPNQWEKTLQCNVVSHWLGACTKWSLHKTLVMLNLTSGNIKNRLEFSMISQHWYNACSLVMANMPVSLLIQYHYCWWPGDTRTQGISNNGIDIVITEYSGLSTGGVNNFHISSKNIQ